MAGLPESLLDMDEIMREWLMALEYVARTAGKGPAETEQVRSDAGRVGDEVLEDERRAAPVEPDELAEPRLAVTS